MKRNNLLSAIMLCVIFLCQAYLACSSRQMGGQISQLPSEQREYARSVAPSAPPSVRPMRRGDYDSAAGVQDALGETERTADERTSGRQKASVTERMVVYDGKYRLDVESVQSCVKEVEKLADRYKGFVESIRTSDSYRRAEIVMRVPVAKFDDALRDVESLGEVKYKQITASDVTMQFNDINLRMNTADRVRERLYELLKRSEKAKERVQILQEIARLNDVIESYRSQMNYLKDRASFSTVSLDVYAKVRDIARQFISSPFRWIAGLTPAARSIRDDGDGLSYEAPKGFFNLKEDFYKRGGKYLFQDAARSVSVRAGVTDNYPPADIKFWGEAFEIDMQNRMYKLYAKDSFKGKNALEFKRYIVKSGETSLYMVAFAVHDRKIIVVEANMAGEEAWKKHVASVDQFLKSMEYR